MNLVGAQLIELYQSFIAEYPIVSIEDGFDQDDWSSWAAFTKSTSIQVLYTGVTY